MRRHGVNPEDVEPPADGVFRAVPSDSMADAPNAVSQVRRGWEQTGLLPVTEAHWLDIVWPGLAQRCRCEGTAVLF
jgi:hypothetical protein